MKIQEGYSLCVLGYSVEAALTRPVDIERLTEFAKILDKDVKLEDGVYVSIGDLTVYAEDVMISKGRDLKEVKKNRSARCSRSSSNPKNAAAAVNAHPDVPPVQSPW